MSVIVWLLIKPDGKIYQEIFASEEKANAALKKEYPAGVLIFPNYRVIRATITLG